MVYVANPPSVYATTWRQRRPPLADRTTARGISRGTPPPAESCPPSSSDFVRQPPLGVISTGLDMVLPAVVAAMTRATSSGRAARRV